MGFSDTYDWGIELDDESVDVVQELEDAEVGYSGASGVNLPSVPE